MYFKTVRVDADVNCDGGDRARHNGEHLTVVALTTMVHKVLQILMALLFVLSRTSARRSFGHTAAFQVCSRHLLRAKPHDVGLFSTHDTDVQFMNEAIKHARKGLGRTFPNPAVGCVLVRQDTNEIVGAGFHPQAGFPHAEVFALLEASGHVPSGVKAAMAIVNNNGDSQLLQTVVDLTKKYASPDDNGPEKLFAHVFESTPVTAYVTLEPCCHFGKTPPCAASLVISQVDRVVVGFRDPNPRVAGGGVQLLKGAGISVDFAQDEQARECATLVDCFVKRITPRDNDDYSAITGGMRRALRSLAGRKKTDSTLAVMAWPSAGPSVSTHDADLAAQVDALTLDPSWVEALDACLWQEELVLVRLNNAVAKKKGAKMLGERIAAELGAHVAQTVGHTVLLYRPGIPPILDLQELLEEYRSKDED